MSKFNIEEGKINSKGSDRFDFLPGPTPSFTAVFVLSSSPLPASPGLGERTSRPVSLVAKDSDQTRLSFVTNHLSRLPFC